MRPGDVIQGKAARQMVHGYHGFLVIVLFQFVYSLVGTLRHLAMGEWNEHTSDHALGLVVSAYLLWYIRHAAYVTIVMFFRR